MPFNGRMFPLPRSPAKDGARYLVDALPIPFLCADGGEFNFFFSDEEGQDHILISIAGVGMKSSFAKPVISGIRDAQS